MTSNQNPASIRNSSSISPKTEGFTAVTSVSENLTCLRNNLRSLGIHGFVIPKTDPHQNEYIPEHFERLSWISNFTGSAGMCIVLQNKAAVFVDGRYTLQAQDEVDKALFEIEPLSWASISAWVEKSLGKDQTLGFDPWITLKSQKDYLEKACLKAQGSLKGIPQNPLDALMADRPPLPSNPIVSHDEKYAGKSASDKITQITKTM